MTIDNG